MWISGICIHNHPPTAILAFSSVMKRMPRWHKMHQCVWGICCKIMTLQRNKGATLITCFLWPRKPYVTDITHKLTPLFVLHQGAQYKAVYGILTVGTPNLPTMYNYNGWQWLIQCHHITQASTWTVSHILLSCIQGPLALHFGTTVRKLGQHYSSPGF